MKIRNINLIIALLFIIGFELIINIEGLLGFVHYNVGSGGEINGFFR